MPRLFFILNVVILLAGFVAVNAAPSALCDITVTPSDYREQRDGNLFREITLSVDVKSRSAFYANHLMNAKVRLYAGSNRRHLIGEQTLTDVKEVQNGAQLEFFAGPEQGIEFSYLNPFFDYWVQVVRANGKVACSTSVSKTNVVRLRQDQLAKDVCTNPESPEFTSLNEKFLINPGQQPFTLDEIKVIKAALDRAEKVYDGDVLTEQKIDENNLPATVALLKQRAQSLFRTARSADPSGVDEESLAFLANRHQSYSVGKSLRHLPGYLTGILVTATIAFAPFSVGLCQDHHHRVFSDSGYRKVIDGSPIPSGDFGMHSKTYTNWKW